MKKGSLDISPFDKRKNHNDLFFKNKYAFIIGINDYKHVSKLQTAVNDSIKLAEILEKQHGYQIHQLCLNPTYSQLLSYIKDASSRPDENDCVLFYFAGHGVAMDSEDGIKGYLLPVDAEINNVDSLLSMALLNELCSAIPSRHFLLILDCCFAGAFRWSSKRSSEIPYLPRRIYKERFERYILDPAWQVITSAGHDQLAFDLFKKDNILGNRENNEHLHSPFANALFAALGGKADLVPADGGDGIITASELYLYLREHVELLTGSKNVFTRQTPGLHHLPRHDKGEFVFFVPGHTHHLPSVPKRNPYKGLQSYEEVDYELFFGREKSVVELMQKVMENQLIVLTGPSGTGKSSLIKAGVLPKLRHAGFHILPIVRPTAKPIEVLRSIVIPQASKGLLVIDQFEELITQCTQADDRDDFMAALRCWLVERHLKIVITIRSDFEPFFNHFFRDDAWSTGRLVVPPFTIEQLRQVILRPAIQEVVTFDHPVFIDHIVEEVVQQQGVLPLLSFLLSELYERGFRKGERTLYESDYYALGGVIGSLRQKADALYESLQMQPDLQKAMRQLMLRMVSVSGGEYTARRVMQWELLFDDATDNLYMFQVIEKLLHARLIVAGQDSQGYDYLEPAHDALVRAWNRILEWVQAFGSENLLLLGKLSTRIREFEISGKDAKYLWNNDIALDQVQQAVLQVELQLNLKEAAFILESERLREEQRQKMARLEREGAWREMAQQVSKDLKGPLTTMRLSMQQLQRVSDNPEQASGYLKKATNRLLEQIDSLQQIVAEFGQFASLDQVVREAIEFNDLVAGAFDLFSNQNLNISLQLPDEKLMITGNPNHLVRVLNNLIINAIQACSTQSPAQVELSLSHVSEQAVFKIRDYGSGVPPEIQGRIFEPNFTTKTSGSGLGLAICKKIIEAHDGSIWFESRQTGTDFFVSLPITSGIE